MLLLKSFTADFGRDSVGPHICTEYVNEAEIHLTRLILVCKKTKTHQCFLVLSLNIGRFQINMTGGLSDN